MTEPADRLYQLLPAVYRQRDAEQGFPLQALLRVIAEQLGVVEDDVARLYENLFIETCEEWVVPYLGNLVGYRPVEDAGEPGDPATAEGRRLNAVLVPRREVANTVRYRRRKGTLALLELLARDVAGWPARAVELCRLLAQSPDVRFHPVAAGSCDLRAGDALDRLDGPFDELPHSADVRRVVSRRQRGFYNVPNVGLFAWRLRAFPVSRTPACCLEEAGPHCYTFSVLGNDSPLFVRPAPEEDPTLIAGELELPVPIRRRRLERDLGAYYGEGGSFQVWEQPPFGDDPPPPIAPERLVVADLDGWHYRPLPGGKAGEPGQVAIDPVRGRIAFPPGRLPEEGVWVSYAYGFSAEIGGGEYPRSLPPPPEAYYPVGDGHDHGAGSVEGELGSLGEALVAWKKDAPETAVIEILRSAVYTEPVHVRLRPGQSLTIRAADGARPVIRLLDWQSGRPDSLLVQVEEAAAEGVTVEDAKAEKAKTKTAKTKTAKAKKPSKEDRYQEEEEKEETEETPETGEQGCPPRSSFTLDGLLIAGRGMRVRGPLDELCVRHSTLVPGWLLDAGCEARRPLEASLELFDTRARLRVERSIVGTIQVIQDEVGGDPIAIELADSVLDATGEELEALGAPGCPRAHAVLTVRRSTVFGKVLAHAIELAENSLFMGRVEVARRQLGCMRFCYAPPGSRTPRRYRCQPDGAAGSLEGAARRRAELRVLPRFESTRYGTPTYCRLALGTAEEIVRGADDRSEMGVFHHLYQPQRAAILQARLTEYTPAGMEAGLIFAS